MRVSRDTLAPKMRPIQIRDRDPAIDVEALGAAAAAVIAQLGREANQQGSYLHTFIDGHVSAELEWIDPAGVARAAIVAYLRHVKPRAASE